MLKTMTKSQKNGSANGVENEKEANEAWKTADLRNWIKQDLKAAIAVLDLIYSNPQLFEMVCVAIEGWREDMLKKEVTMKKDFVNE